MHPSICRHETRFPIFALNWSFRSDEPFRLAFSSMVAAPNSYVHVIRIDPYQRIRPISVYNFRHPQYTPNTLAFLPDPGCHYSDLLASAGDTLRLWHLHGNSASLRCQLGDYPTTFLKMLDWNRMHLQRIATLRSDNTCTVWNIDAGLVEAHLFTSPSVHAIHDVAWGAPALLAATSADGRVKCVDLRDGRHANIYNVSGGFAERVEWNYMDPNYLAVTVGSSRVLVLDARRLEAVAEMRRHNGSVNTMAWDPHSPSRICTAGDDTRPLVWEITAPGQTQVVAQYEGDAAVQQLKWSWLHPELVAFGCGNRLQIERVE